MSLEVRILVIMLLMVMITCPVLPTEQLISSNFLNIEGYDGNSVMNDMFRCRLASIEVPPSSLVDDFKVLINDDEMSDVKFLVNGEIFHAHRCILAVRSQYFRAMLFNQWRESTSNEGIVLTDVSSEVFLKR